MISKELVKLENIQYSWNSTSSLVLHIPKFQIQPGQKIFLYGPSGSGKSTLLNLIAGVLNSQQGAISVLGQDLSQMSASEKDLFRGDHMGFIFQQFNLIPYLTAYENIILPLNFSKRRASKVPDIKKTVQALASRLDIQNELYKKPSQMSVGQQQRIAAARSLIGAPELIIADEPTSSLDQERRDQFLELLISEAQRTNASVLFVSHDKTLQKHFDTILDIKELNQASRLL